MDYNTHRAEAGPAIKKGEGEGFQLRIKGVHVPITCPHSNTLIFNKNVVPTFGTPRSGLATIERTYSCTVM